MRHCVAVLGCSGAAVRTRCSGAPWALTRSSSAETCEGLLQGTEVPVVLAAAAAVQGREIQSSLLHLAALEKLHTIAMKKVGPSRPSRQKSPSSRDWKHRILRGCHQSLVGRDKWPGFCSTITLSTGFVIVTVPNKISGKTDPQKSHKRPKYPLNPEISNIILQ